MTWKLSATLTGIEGFEPRRRVEWRDSTMITGVSHHGPTEKRDAAGDAQAELQLGRCRDVPNTTNGPGRPVRLPSSERSGAPGAELGAVAPIRRNAYERQDDAALTRGRK